MVAHHALDGRDRVGEQDVFRDHSEVVIDVHADRVVLSVRVARLEKDGEAVVIDLLAHHRGGDDLGPPHILHPTRERRVPEPSRELHRHASPSSPSSTAR